MVHVHRLESREASKVKNIAHENVQNSGWNWGIRGRAACVYRVRDYPFAQVGLMKDRVAQGKEVRVRAALESLMTH